MLVNGSIIQTGRSSISGGFHCEWFLAVRLPLGLGRLQSHECWHRRKMGWVQHRATRPVPAVAFGWYFLNGCTETWPGPTWRYICGLASSGCSTMLDLSWIQKALWWLLFEATGYSAVLSSFLMSVPSGHGFGNGPNTNQPAKMSAKMQTSRPNAIVSNSGWKNAPFCPSTAYFWVNPWVSRLVFGLFDVIWNICCHKWAQLDDMIDSCSAQNQ